LVADKVGALSAWLDEYLNSSWRVVAKRLAGNDTLATGSHQAGPNIPKPITFTVCPSLRTSDEPNPYVSFPAAVDSHSIPERPVRLYWYNQKTRNECRITRWGGVSSPVLDPESTGSVCLFAFAIGVSGDAEYCRVWVCDSLDEENYIESSFGAIEPGVPVFLNAAPVSELLNSKVPHEPYAIEEKYSSPAYIGQNEDLFGGLHEMPSGGEIVDRVIEVHPELVSLDPDRRLLRRRDLEYAEFRRLEEHAVLPIIRDGFSNVDAFVEYANSVTNRRKARSGRSLELHALRIFDEEGIVEYSHDQPTEGSRRPDFLFPSVAAYKDATFPSERLLMLACKTTCKDRWRQVLDEVRPERIPVKHLLTLQEGVAEGQFKQMQEADVVLVVPKPLHKTYPVSVRSDLVEFGAFIEQLKSIS